MSGSNTRAAGRSALRVVSGGADPRSAVLVLHGGREAGREPARAWQPAALRMRPFLTAVSHAVPHHRLLVGSVRYRYRGWNGAAADPLRDTEDALAELARRVGDIPVVLLGHSMGGRAALRAAGAPHVRGVVALAPWCPDGEPTDHLRDRTAIVVHGDQDRITDPRASTAMMGRARAQGARTATLVVAGGDHAMLRRGRVWHRTATAAVAEVLVPGAGSPVVRDVLKSGAPHTI
ncbi:alpha/beta fold hydrolase [Streptomyces sp. NPDC050264]|uniref:alpha/beta fold hydrolase n=1 Tax=Streptomyces sp. NPDC050264 TaxID=3155038 RepID=UPI003414B4BD